MRCLSCCLARVWPVCVVNAFIMFNFPSSPLLFDSPLCLRLMLWCHPKWGGPIRPAQTPYTTMTVTSWRTWSCCQHQFLYSHLLLDICAQARNQAKSTGKNRVFGLITPHETDMQTSTVDRARQETPRGYATCSCFFTHLKHNALGLGRKTEYLCACDVFWTHRECQILGKSKLHKEFWNDKDVLSK